MDKPGYKTTEFWLSFVGAILGLLNQSGVIGHPLPVDSVLAVAAPIVAYTVSRGVVKGSKLSLRNVAPVITEAVMAGISKPVDASKLNQ